MLATVPLSLLTAIAVVLLKELAMLDDAAPPTAAAVPMPSAEAFRRLSELALVFVFVFDFVTVVVRVSVLLSVLLSFF
ncbi:hypothetical protein D3C72_1200350 [compost metagenome]